MKNPFKDFKFTVGSCFKIAGYLLLATYVVFIAFGSLIFDPLSDFWRSLNVFGTAGEFNIIIRIISYAILCLGASWIIRKILHFIAGFLKKGKAIIDLSCSLIKTAGIIILAFFVLSTLGVDTSAILAGIGIFGLVVGLGAQPLIADILAGLFIVIERVFDVGDIIVADGFRGAVLEIGIRTTKLVDTSGNVKIMNNADLKSIVNMTDQLSLAVCDMSIEYGESLERVEAILKDNFDLVRQNIPDIKNGPFYKGVAALADSAVVIRIAAQCDEGARFQVERDMNRQFKLIFDRNNINIPFPQIVLNQPVTFEEATKFQQAQAKEFVEEQKELSKGIADADANNV